MANKGDLAFEGTVPVQNLIIELMAGGLSEKIIKSILHKFDRESKGYVDFMDYLTYIHYL